MSAAAAAASLTFLMRQLQFKHFCEAFGAHGSVVGKSSVSQVGPRHVLEQENEKRRKHHSA